MSSKLDFRLAVAGEVRAELARRQLSGIQLATALQCSQQTASRRLTGATPFTLDDLAAVSLWLDVPVEHILGSAMARMRATQSICNQEHLTGAPL